MPLDFAKLMEMARTMNKEQLAAAVKNQVRAMTPEERKVFVKGMCEATEVMCAATAAAASTEAEKKGWQPIPLIHQLPAGPEIH